MKKKTMIKKNKNDSSFEEMLFSLENLVKELEEENFDLDLSIKKFEEGVRLYKICKDQLNNAEKKIRILSDSLQENEI